MYLIALLLGIVEGLTEFVPVSSTGHLILAGHLLHFTGAKAETFEIFIQLGAILAVLSLFPGRFLALTNLRATHGFAGLRGLGLIALTTIPGLILGKAVHGYIKTHLFNPMTVALGLFLGALLMIGIEILRSKHPKTMAVEALNWKKAFGIGCFQCLALWPGMSRSSSTMVGGMWLGLSRAAAAEYSFLAAVPLISAAVLYDLYKSWSILAWNDLGVFGLGFIVSWFFAWVSMRFLLKFLTNHSLVLFATYRILIALLVLSLWR